MTGDTTQLDWILSHERSRPDAVWLTQPMDSGVIRDITFACALDEARRMAAHLASRGFPPGSRIAIFSKNTAWWLIADLAIWIAGHVSVPIYPTLTPESIRKILEHSETRLVFVGKLDRYSEMAPGLPDELPRVTLPLSPPEAALDGVRSWDEIISSTQPIEGAPRRTPDELATIIYTSGSTGDPKGAMHSFHSMCAIAVLTGVFGFRADDRMISYLPLAHVAERALLETTTFKVGFHVYFSESLATFANDLRRARPTIFGSVPRLWQKLQEGVLAKMPASRLALLLRIPILGSVVARKVREGLGLDQARKLVTGSAPTPAELVSWYRALGINIGEMYGMTENFVLSHISMTGQERTGWVGTPAPGVIAKLSEEGEVLVKSPAVMLGYYKNKALSRETVDADGFLHTGDLGEIDAQGRLRISGRVKELFKTSKGKYVAPMPIESALFAHPDVDQACVSGVGRPQPHALVVLAATARTAAPSAREAIAARLEAHLEATNAGFDQHERLEKIFVVPEEWSPENGLLTPTLKLRRTVIEDRYAARVGPLHERPERIVWIDAS